MPPKIPTPKIRGKYWNKKLKKLAKANSKNPKANTKLTEITENEAKINKNLASNFSNAFNDFDNAASQTQDNQIIEKADKNKEFTNEKDIQTEQNKPEIILQNKEKIQQNNLQNQDKLKLYLSRLQKLKNSQKPEYFGKIGSFLLILLTIFLCFSIGFFGIGIWQGLQNKPTVTKIQNEIQIKAQVENKSQNSSNYNSTFSIPSSKNNSPNENFSSSQNSLSNNSQINSKINSQSNLSSSQNSSQDISQNSSDFSSSKSQNSEKSSSSQQNSQDNSSQNTSQSTSLNNNGQISRIEKMKANVEQILGQNRNNFTVYFKDMKTGEKFDIDGTKEMPPASISKLPAAILTLKAAQNGEFSLNDGLELQEELKYIPEDPMSNYRSGVAYPIREYVRNLITGSDNTAMRHLEYLHGETVVYGQKLAKIGIKLTRWPHITTAVDVGNVFEGIYEQRWLNKANNDYLFSLVMSHNKWNSDRLVLAMKKFPEAKVANKIGQVTTTNGITYHDAGIIFGPKTDFVIVILNEDTTADIGITKIVQISQYLYGELNR
jgi:beta-lactamase class A